MSSTSNNRTTQIYVLGFIIIFGAFIASFDHSYQQFSLHRSQFVQETANNDLQQKAAMDMRVAVRERAILLWHMTLTDDVFDRDELFEKFYAHGSDFLVARRTFLATALTADEQSLFARLETETKARAPVLRQFADFLQEDKDSSTSMLDVILTEQIVVANLLDQLIDLQQQQNEKARERSSQGMADILKELLLLIIIIVTLGFVFAGYVIMTAARQSRMLAAANHELKHIASHDHLTGLPNRAFLMHQLDKTLAHVKRSQKRAAILFIDLDNFKPINDEFGHDAGDECLKVLSTRISQTIRTSDLAGRLGGDEFIVVLNEIATPEKAIHVAQKLLQALSAEMLLRNTPIRVSASIGIALLQEDCEEPETVIKAADNAMYKAKQAGKNQIFLQPKSDVQPEIQVVSTS